MPKQQQGWNVASGPTGEEVTVRRSRRETWSNLFWALVVGGLVGWWVYSITGNGWFGFIIGGLQAATYSTGRTLGLTVAALRRLQTEHAQLRSDHDVLQHRHDRLRSETNAVTADLHVDVERVRAGLGDLVRAAPRQGGVPLGGDNTG